MIESTYKGARILQFELLLRQKELFHAIFLKETPFSQVESLLDGPCCKAEQVHSNKVLEAPAIEPCDGLVTKEKGLSLLIAHADCQAAIMYDPVSGLLACVHAGWRGLVQKIYTITLEELRKRGASLKHLLVAISPSLGADKGEFKDWPNYFPPHFSEYLVKENHFDLRLAAYDELLTQGISPENIEIASSCTATDSRFYSWRRDKTSDRHATVAMIKKT